MKRLISALVLIMVLCVPAFAASKAKSFSADEFIGRYRNEDDIVLVIWREKGREQDLCVLFAIPRLSSGHMYGRPSGNVLEVEFDYTDTNSMKLVKYEHGIKEEENLDLHAKLTMINKNRIEVEVSPDLERLHFDFSDKIFIRTTE